MTGSEMNKLTIATMQVEALREQLADAQATVEALQKKYDDLLGKYRQLVDFYDKHNGTPCEQIRHQQQVEALQRERDFFETAAATANRMRVDTERALDAEREKVKELEQQVQDQSTSNLEIMRHTDDMQSRALDAERALAQLQALVRALPVPEEGGFPIVEVDGDYYVNHTSRFSTKAEADAYTGLLIYRATLDATTPDSNQLGDINDMVSKGGDGE